MVGESGAEMRRMAIGAVSLLLAFLAAITGGTDSAETASARENPAPEPLCAVNLWLSDIVQRWVSSEGPLTYVGATDVTHDGFVELILEQDGYLFSPIGVGDGLFVNDSGSYRFFCPTTEGLCRFPVPAHPTGSTICDLDGDGDEDLVVSGIFINPSPDAAVKRGPRLFVFEGRGPSWKFFAPEPVWIDMPETCYWLRPVLENDDSFTILGVALESGGDRFRAYAIPCSSDLELGTLALVLEAEGWPFHVGDFDGDGYVDIAVIHRPYGIGIAYGGPRWEFRCERILETQEDRIQRATAGDVDGDGLLDVVLLTPRGVSVARNAAVGFRMSLPIPVDADDLYLSDLTGDGALDLVTELRDELAILPGDGTGRFDPASSSAFVFPLPLIGVAFADLNGDGRTDIVGESISHAMTVINGGEAKGETWIPFDGSAPLGVGDVDWDGDVDLLVERLDGIDILRSDGAAAFLREAWLDDSELSLDGEEQGEYLHLLSAKQAADGTLYVLGQRSRPCVVEGVRTHCILGELYSVSPAGDVLAGWELGSDVIGALATGDFDANGTSDVAVSSTETLYVLWNGVAVNTYSWRGNGGGAIVAGDFDVDGVDELVAVHREGDLRLVRVEVSLLGMSLGPTLACLDGVPLNLTAADLDEDGVADPVAVVVRICGTEEDGHITLSIDGVDLVAYASSRGEAVVSTMDEFPENSMPWPLNGLAITDLTGDGIPDATCTPANGSLLTVLMGSGDGGFVTYEAPWLVDDELLADLTSDGLPDGLCYVRGPEFTLSPCANTHVAVGPLLVADLDGNGIDEVISATLGLDPALWIQWNGGKR